jgi:hypothetical protein
VPQARQVSQNNRSFSSIVAIFLRQLIGERRDFAAKLTGMLLATMLR